MPRTARIAIPDVPVHITQRGNNRQDVFVVDDRHVNLSILREQSKLKRIPGNPKEKNRLTVPCFRGKYRIDHKRSLGTAQ
jgi:hypothetical protein